MRFQSGQFLTALALTLGALGLSAAGCELIASVDRQLIDQEGVGGTGMGGSGGTAMTGGMGGTGGSGGMGGAGGSGGMSCKTEADCPPPANECITATCLNGMCGEMNVAQGTPAATQVDGDCMMNQCTGTGMIETIKDNSDPAEDMKECTAGTCQADGSTTHAPVNLGTPCSENGGALCNNMGACVECLTTIDCTVVVGEICQNGNCVPPACANAAQDGAETDIDCGGPDCNKCGTNKNCMMSSDCISSVCTGNKCQAATCTDTTKNGSETDVDCGGATCPKCAGGMMCSVGSDCVSGSCQAGVCTMGGAGGAGGSGGAGGAGGN